MQCVGLCCAIFAGAGLYAQDYGENVVYMRIQRMGARWYVGLRTMQVSIASWLVVLFKLICGFYTADQGRVIVDGKELGKDSDIPENIGSIIETPGFLGNFSGYRNLKYLADINGRAGKEAVCRAMERVGLEPGSRKKVRKYSLGMKQRLGLAQAFMEDQEILVFDEPMNGLDNQGVEDMRKLFLELKEQGKTLLIASHNHEDIDILCDEVYEMNHGVLGQRS